MTQAEAKMRIPAEWRTWVGHRQVADSHTSAESSVFFERSSKITPTCFRSKALMTSGSLQTDGW
jgi:hypothetical protein